MSLATLPPTQVPTLTEVVDWPPVLSLDAELPAPLLHADADTDAVDAAATEAVTRTADADIAPTDGADNHTDSADDVEVCLDAPVESGPTEPAEVVPPQIDAPAEAAELPPAIDEAALTQRVLADLQQQVDALLEQQLRTTMQPLLDQLVTTLAQQSSGELASALRDMVALAVSREMMRLRAEPLRDDPG